MSLRLRLLRLSPGYLLPPLLHLSDLSPGHLGRVGLGLSLCNILGLLSQQVLSLLLLLQSFQPLLLSIFFPRLTGRLVNACSNSTCLFTCFFANCLLSSTHLASSIAASLAAFSDAAFSFFLSLAATALEFIPIFFPILRVKYSNLQ